MRTGLAFTGLRRAGLNGCREFHLVRLQHRTHLHRMNDDAVSHFQVREGSLDIAVCELSFSGDSDCDLLMLDRKNRDLVP